MKETEFTKQRNIALESFGLIMLKPHSLIDGTSQSVRSFLYGQNPNLKEQLRITPPVSDYLCRMVVLRSLLINLGDGTENSQRILDAFYLSDSHLPHYPILRQVYSAPAEFHLIGYPGNQIELDILLKKLKGNPLVIDENGSERRSPLGIRGALLPTAIVTSAEEQGQIDISSVDYMASTIRMLNNIIHATDGIHESIPALTAMFGEREIIEMEEEGIYLKRFISQPL